MLLWFLFGVSGIVPKVLKLLVFSQFWGLLWGGLFLVYLGLEGLGVLVFLCLFFFICLGSVSVFLLCFCLVVGLFLVLVLVLLLFCLFFCFFGFFVFLLVLVFFWRV